MQTPDSTSPATDGVGSGGTGLTPEQAMLDSMMAAARSLTGTIRYLVFVTGIEDDPDFVMLVEAPNEIQARRVAKRMVEQHRSLDGLGFRIEKA